MKDDQTISPGFKKHLNRNKNADVQIFWDSNHGDMNIRGYALRKEALQIMGKNGVKTVFLEMAREYNDTLDKFNRGEISATDLKDEMRARFETDKTNFSVFDKNGRIIEGKSANEEFLKRLELIAGNSRAAGIAILGADKKSYFLSQISDEEIAKRINRDNEVADFMATEMEKRGGKAAAVYGELHGARRVPRVPTLSDIKSFRLSPNDPSVTLPDNYKSLPQFAQRCRPTLTHTGAVRGYDGGGIDDGLKTRHVRGTGRNLSVAQIILTADGNSFGENFMPMATPPLVSIADGRIMTGAEAKTLMAVRMSMPAKDAENKMPPVPDLKIKTLPGPDLKLNASPTSRVFRP